MSKTYRATINFIRDVLGTQPADPDIRRKYIEAKFTGAGKTGNAGDVAVAKSKMEQEIENFMNDKEIQDKIEEIAERGLTVFYRDNESQIALSDVILRGWFKAAFAHVAHREKWFTYGKEKKNRAENWLRKWIGERIAFHQQYIPIPDENFYIFVRPIRIEYMGESKSSIIATETAKAPFAIQFDFSIEDDVNPEWLPQILERGKWKGMGQWNNAQWGTFTYKLEEITE